MIRFIKIHGHRRRIFFLLAVLSALLLSQAVPLALAASSPWSQTDWSTGNFASSANATTSTANQITLTPTEKLTNNGFEADLSGWTTTSIFKDSDFAAASGAVAAWPLDDTISTQNYARVINPPGATGRNIVINGTFDTDATWIKDVNATISGGTLNLTSSSGLTYEAGPIVTGKAYQVTFTVSNYSSGSVKAYIAGSQGTVRTANGTYAETIIAGSTTSFAIGLNPTSFTGSIDGVTVTRVNIPAYNATPTQLLADGNMESAGMSSWIVGGAATLSKQTVNPHGGSQVLRIARNSTNNPYAHQVATNVNTVYRFTGYARSDGSALPSITNFTTTLWTGTSSTEWQPFDVTFVATYVAGNVALQALTSTGTQYVEFDDVVVSIDRGIRTDELTQDGNMEASSTSRWTAQNSTLTKETASAPQGAQFLRATYSSGNFGVLQANDMATGKRYVLTGQVKANSAATLNVYMGSGTIGTISATTTWQTFSITGISDGGASNRLLIIKVGGSSGDYFDLDSLTLVEVDPLVGIPTNGVTVGSTAGGHLTNAYTFDGTNDNVNIYSSDLNSTYNPAEGTMIVWAKVASAGVWTDGVVRTVAILFTDSNNQIRLRKLNTNDSFQFLYYAAGVTKIINVSSLSNSGWMQVVLTWSKSNDEVKAYINGSQVSTTQTGLGTWTGNLISTNTVLGAADTSGSSSWSGMINDVRLYSRALSASEINTLYTGVVTTRDTMRTYNSSVGAAKIVAPSDQTAVMTESINVGDTNNYNFVAYAYTSGVAVTAADASLSVNGSAVSTTYTSVGGGWYKLSATVVGVASAINYGVQVEAGKTVYIDNISLSNYPTSGTLTSSIFDSGQGSNWGTLSFSATTPTNTTATVKVRTGNQSDLSDATAFSSCTTIASGATVGGTSCAANNKRYAQYLITLSTSDVLVTPTFTSFSVPFSTSDISAPELTLSLLTPDPINENTPTLTGTATESIGTVSSVQFQIDGTSGSWTSCSASDGSYNSAIENFSCTTSSLSDGSHTMYVRSTDSNGNTTSTNFPSDAFTIDTVAPISISLDSPGDNSFTADDRPTFRWRMTSDATSGVAKYILHTDLYTIDDIPANRTSDYETNKYVIHYENFSDADSTNNYISVHTKSSPAWSTAENDGRLKEGKVNWNVTAVDNASNSTNSGWTLFVDQSSPTVQFTQINAVPVTTNSFTTTDTTPTLFGRLTDPLVNTVTSGLKQVDISVEKKNGLLYSLVGLTTITLNESRYTCDDTLVTDRVLQRCSTYSAFEFIPKQPLDLGDYRISLSGKDNAGNSSSTEIVYLHVRTGSQLPLPSSTPKATLTASPMATSVPAASVQPTAVPTVAPTTTPQSTPESDVTLPDAPQGPSVMERTGSALANILSFLIGGLSHGLSTVGSGIAWVGSGVGSIFNGIGSGISTVYTSIAQQAPGLLRGSMLAFGNTVHTITNFFSSTTSFIASAIGKGVGNASNSLGNMIVSIGYVFVREPTKIYEVRVEILSATSAKISWKTNNPANGKVNYGLDETYPMDVQSEDRVTDHEFTLTNLTPGTEYHFEVMSQNKNYVYDANRRFTTPEK